MSDGLPGPRCNRYVDGGGLTSYPCKLEEHDGPCVAIEIPASLARRQAWEAEQARASFSPRPAPSGVPAPPAALDPKVLADPLDREVLQLKALQGTFASLPEWAKAEIISHSAQASLGTLYHLARQQFEQGAPVVTISPEFLERLITPSVRRFFDMFTTTTK